MDKKSTILIVDDNRTNLAIMEEILENYEVFSATDGEEALKRAKNLRPDLILLDIMMPGIDGYEVCRTIREDPVLRLGKIIMVSAKALTSERLEGYKAGADDYITKPFDESELLAKVEVYLRLKSEEEVSQLKSDFLRLLHLETNNPLNSILGPVDILKDNAEMGPEDRIRWLDIIRRGAVQLQELFEKVVTLSTIRSGKLDSEKEPFDLSTLAREAVVKVSRNASEKGIEIRQDILPSAYAIVDRQQITRVVITLLQNAIRFSSNDEQINLELKSENGLFRLRISDHGIGIPAEILPCIFDEFVSRSLTYHSKGNGLNLAIAHHIVVEHKGHIGVESEEGKGTTFTIKLPQIEED